MSSVMREAVIEIPRGGLIKRTALGAIDFISPLPCPFNYGSVPGTLSDDGDPLDAVVLGPRLRRGARVVRRQLGCVRFRDAGQDDPKLVLGTDRLGAIDRARVQAFFQVYAIAKRALNRVRGKHGATRYDGIEVL